MRKAKKMQKKFCGQGNQYDMFDCSDPTCGGKNYMLNWIFLLKYFWSIDIFVVKKGEWYHSSNVVFGEKIF